MRLGPVPLGARGFFGAVGALGFRFAAALAGGLGARKSPSSASPSSSAGAWSDISLNASSSSASSSLVASDRFRFSMELLTRGEEVSAAHLPRSRGVPTRDKVLCLFPFSLRPSRLCSVGHGAEDVGGCGQDSRRAQSRARVVSCFPIWFLTCLQQWALARLWPARLSTATPTTSLHTIIYDLTTSMAPGPKIIIRPRRGRNARAASVREVSEDIEERVDVESASGSAPLTPQADEDEDEPCFNEYGSFAYPQW